MTSSIQSPRWRGRLIATLFHFVSQYGIALPDEKDLCLNELLDEVYSNVGEEHRLLLDRVKARFEASLESERAAGVSFAEDEDERLCNLGKKDVRLCLAMQGNIQNIDTYEDLAAEDGARRRKDRRSLCQTLLIVAIPFVILLAVFVYRAGFTGEWALFHQVEKERTQELIEEYKLRYPDGRYLEDVCLLEIAISRDPYGQLQVYRQRFPNGKHLDDAYQIALERSDNPIDIVEDYLRNYPKGKNLEKYVALLDSLYELKHNAAPAEEDLSPAEEDLYSAKEGGHRRPRRGRGK